MNNKPTKQNIQVEKHTADKLTMLKTEELKSYDAVIKEMIDNTKLPGKDNYPKHFIVIATKAQYEKLKDNGSIVEFELDGKTYNPKCLFISEFNQIDESTKNDTIYFACTFKYVFEKPNTILFNIMFERYIELEICGM